MSELSKGKDGSFKGAMMFMMDPTMKLLAYPADGRDWIDLALKNLASHEIGQNSIIALPVFTFCLDYMIEFYI